MLSSLNLLEKRKLYLNRSFKPLKSPQPVLLDLSYFFLSSRLHPFTDKPMVITKPLSEKNQAHDSDSSSLSRVRWNRPNEKRLCWKAFYARFSNVCQDQFRYNIETHTLVARLEGIKPRECIIQCPGSRQFCCFIPPNLGAKWILMIKLGLF